MSVVRPPPIPYQPIAPSTSILLGLHYRITILTDGLIRYEWSEDGKFEDRPSTFAINRNLPTPKFELIEKENLIKVITDRFELEYDRKPFSPNGFTVVLRENARFYNKMWRYGLPVQSNLGGTARTLDFYDGPVPLQPGVLSRDGFAMIDDSKSMMFAEDGWVASRVPGRSDGYLFAFGFDYRAALKAFFDISGHQPILPRWALGNWWSRWHDYSDIEYLDLMDRFKSEGLPFSVAVLDMGWHLTKISPKYGAGWTGWTWNDELFPDHVEFLKQLHKRHLKTTLCTHPADGVRAYEKPYAEMAKALGRDPKTGHTIVFHPTNREFLEAYFKFLHHPLEDEGVDFWWLDWQQGEYTSVPGIDPLWMLNHYHFLDSGRDNKRPVAFSRYAGPGSQRYPIGFSGDTEISWKTLEFQPEFTATASNIGYSWWSHDIGGHHRGYKDDELEARWMQYGLWSPIFRPHCDKSIFLTPEPWRFNDETREVINRSLRFRHRLVPYLYTTNVRVATQGTSLCEPMYYDHPEVNEAYEYKNQYTFGSELIVAPITTPRVQETTYGKTTAWLPPGRFVDIFTNMVYDGNRDVVFHRPLDKCPVLAKEGAIIPLDGAEIPGNGCLTPTSLEIFLVVGADGQFELVEDAGVGASIRDIEFSRTPIKYTHSTGTLTIGPTSNPLVPMRKWSVRLLAYTPSAEIRGTRDSQSLKPRSESTPTGTLVEVGTVPGFESIKLELGTAEPQLDKTCTQDAIFKVLDDGQMSTRKKDVIWNIVQEFGQVPVQIIMSRLAAVGGVGDEVKEAIMECLLADSR